MKHRIMCFFAVFLFASHTAIHADTDKEAIKGEALFRTETDVHITSHIGIIPRLEYRERFIERDLEVDLGLRYTVAVKTHSLSLRPFAGVFLYHLAESDQDLYDMAGINIQLQGKNVFVQSNTSVFLKRFGVQENITFSLDRGGWFTTGVGMEARHTDNEKNMIQVLFFAQKSIRFFTIQGAAVASDRGFFGRGSIFLSFNSK